MTYREQHLPRAMKPHRLRLALIAISLGVACVFAPNALAQNSGTEAQFWPEFDVYLKLSQSNRVFVMSSVTRSEFRGPYADGQTGVFFDHYNFPIFRKWANRSPDPARGEILMLRGGYLFTKPRENSVASTENTFVFLGEGRFPLPGAILLTNRDRFDFRFIDGEFKSRFRPRLRVERTFKIGRILLNPYASVEGFYDFQLGLFRRFDFTGGIEWNINRHFVLEGYSTRVNDSRSTPRFVEGTGIVAQFYFP